MGDYKFVVIQSPKYLVNLKSDAQPIWGDMTPQQMVEHLSLRFAFASKKVIAPSFMSNERMAFYKAKFFNGHIPIRKNFTAKGLIPSDQVSDYKYQNLQEAISVYIQSVEDFSHYFKINPIALTYHPFFGYLSHDEWMFYHAHHIKHHFRQFGLIDENNNPITKQLTLS